MRQTNAQTTPQRGPEAARCPVPYGEYERISHRRLLQWQRQTALPIEFLPWPWQATRVGGMLTFSLRQPVRGKVPELPMSLTSPEP